ncbi:glutathione S-transferase family protein [Vitiosangium sp. GDMCC 1.1324]|uniref:glutathione S-transferase family protein n=1 Tax=Vitiosangium sp. (strain GDMCC 1.1324) TaxID=2138576 RepID=UPI000D33C57C|nr:glutathione S-transferase family protein [Vitiosangium sp. GDMCC 1.1324]PTL79331.1 glutathione S-transferase family protein [Vitiosangium sp. GDMCC 1.1324]
MAHAERTLYQFPISHYCEKTRWNLDAKGLSFRIENLFPGAHRLVTKRLTKGARGTVPVLVDRGTVVTDSTDIALYLERGYPSAPALIPAEGPERERVLELEAYFDEMAGKHVRRWVYAKLFASGTDIEPLMFGGFPLPLRLVGHVLIPVIKRVIRSQYALTPDKVAESKVKLLEGLDRLEREIQGDPSRYLAGHSLSIADIAAASLYAPLVGAEGSPFVLRPGEVLPPEVTEMRAAVMARPAGQWLLRRYQEDRRGQARGFSARAETASG